MSKSENLEQKATDLAASQLNTLNKQQRQAVQHNQGPMLVVAGAGTGKTRVITERIAWLIANQQAAPEEILALTFTDKAAGEMLDRLDVLIGWEAYKVNVMTFHAFGSQLLLRFGHHLGRARRGELIPETAKLVLLRRHLEEADLSYYGGQDDIIDFLSNQLDYIQKLQNADISPERYSEYVAGLNKADVHKLDVSEAEDRLKLYQLYEKVKRDYGLIDYHDQIKLPLELLESRPNLADCLTKQYKYVLVDEYQDTNPAQDRLLRAFIPPGGNIFAVGDDDQAIYGFRGASLSNILNFAEHFGVKRPLVLTKNYRSTQPILDAAYRLIQGNNPDRLEVKLEIDKRLKGQAKGQPPQFVPYPSPQAERLDIVAQIVERIKEGQLPETIAVLATSHAKLRQLAKVLRDEGAPYALSSSVNIFEQAELLQLWHLLRWLNIGAEDESIIQLLHGPFWGYSHSRVRKVSDLAAKRLVSMEEALNRVAAKDPKVKQDLQQLQRWRSWAAELPVSQLLYKLIFDTGVSDRWIKQADSDPRFVRVFEDLQLWLQQCQAYEHTALNSRLAGYLELFVKPPEITTEELTGDEQGVALLTVHAAKGLEFETVYIINNTPHSWSGGGMPGQEELPPELTQLELELPPEHERRRLLYVALTRAKTDLILTAPVRTVAGRAQKTAPFMQELFKPAQLERQPQTVSNQALEESLEKIQQYAPKTLQWQAQRLPFESPDGWLELNATALESYSFCPYEFYLGKVLRIRSPLGPQVAFGQILHHTFHLYYQSRLDGEPLGLAELEQYLEESWIDRGYKTTQEATVARRLAKQTLKAFYDREEKAKRKIRSAEEDFRLTVPEAKLVVKGRIDATFKTTDGIEIRDFKTGRARDAEKLSQKAKNNLQLRTYALAIEAMSGQAPAQVVLDYVVTGTEGVAELSPQILKNHRKKLMQIADSIRARDFQPNSSPMHQCIAHKYWGSSGD